VTFSKSYPDFEEPSGVKAEPPGLCPMSVRKRPELVTLRWRNLVEGVANVTGKGGKTRVVRLSRGTWAQLQGLRTTETIGDGCVFPMSAVNAWKRVKRAARLAGIREVRSRHTSCVTRTARMPCAAAPIWRPCATRSVMRQSRRPAAICTPDPRSLAATTSRSDWHQHHNR
jgi:hypothetical protein